MVHDSSKNKDKAFEFINAIRTEPVQRAISKLYAGALFSVNKLVNNSLTDPLAKTFVEQLAIAKVPEAIDVFPIMNDAIFPAMQAVALKTKSPSDAAAAATERNEAGAANGQWELMPRRATGEVQP